MTRPDPEECRFIARAIESLAKNAAAHADRLANMESNLSAGHEHDCPRPAAGCDCDRGTSDRS